MILSRPRTSSRDTGRKSGAGSVREGVPSQSAPEDVHRGTTVAETLRLSVERPERGVVVVHMYGEIDLASVPRLGELIRQRLTAAALRTVVLDLSGVEFLSSSGLELLLNAQRRAEYRGVELYLIPGARCVQRLLDLTGMTDRFRWRSSVAEAVAAAH